MGTLRNYKLERDLLGAHAVYPGHPVVLALLVTHDFPTRSSAAAPTENGLSAALGSNNIAGGGDMVFSAMRLLDSIASGTKMIDEAITWGDTIWRDSRAGGHADRVEPGQGQAERAKPLLRDRLAIWPLDRKRGVIAPDQELTAGFQFHGSRSAMRLAG